MYLFSCLDWCFLQGQDLKKQGIMPVKALKMFISGDKRRVRPEWLFGLVIQITQLR